MKILLVNPPCNRVSIGQEVHFLTEPLGLETVASGVPHDAVEILDMRLEQGLAKRLRLFEPDIVGVTAYTSDVYSALGVLDQVKKYNNDILTVVGGVHATVRPQDFNMKSVDIIVIGHGVSTFREVVDSYREGGLYEDIPGLAIPREKGLLFTGLREPTLEDALALPNRDLTLSCRKKYYMGPFKPVVSVRTASGCPYRCKFCIIWVINGGRYIERSAESIVDELAGIEEEYIYFADDNTLHNPRRVERMCDLLKRRGIRKQYQVFARTDWVCAHPDLIERLREVGLRAVNIGIEAITDEELRYLDKGTTTSQNEEAIRILHRNDLVIQSSFIIRPDYTKYDFDALAKYVDKMELEFPTFSALTPFPGTRLYDEKRDEITVHDYEMYDLNHSVLPTKLPPKVFHREWAKLYIKSFTPRKVYRMARRHRVQAVMSARSALMFVRFICSLMMGYKHY